MLQRKESKVRKTSDLTEKKHPTPMILTRNRNLRRKKSMLDKVEMPDPRRTINISQKTENYE